MGGRDRLGRARLSRLRDLPGDHLQRLPHPRREGRSGRRMPGRFWPRGAGAGHGLLRRPAGGLSGHQPRGARPLRSHPLAGRAADAPTHLLLQEGERDPFPLLRSGDGPGVGSPGGHDRGRGGARAEYAAVHRGADAPLARQHVHLCEGSKDAATQRRVRPAPRYLQALRRRGGPRRPHGGGLQVLRQHPDALRRPHRRRCWAR